MPRFKQAPRQPTDGPVSVNRNDDDTLTLIATTDGRDGSIRVSEYNAARLFGILGLMLGIELPPSIGKAIKL